MNSLIYQEINDPEKWVPRMARPFNETDLARFQEGLNRIFGLGSDNSPNVRIVWAQDWEQTKVFNRYSGDWYPRYLSHTLEEGGQDDQRLPTLKVQYVAAPRFVIEGRVSQAENALAFVESGEEVIAVVLCVACGEASPPQEGVADPACPSCGSRAGGKIQKITSDTYRAGVADEYEELLRILDHDHLDPELSACCQWNARRDYECWGYYRHPGAGDLKYLEAKWREMQERFQTGPDQQRTAEEKQRFLRERLWEMTEQKRKKKELIKQELGEFWRSKFAKLDQSVTEQHHGPFHFLSGHNPAGIPAN